METKSGSDNLGRLYSEYLAEREESEILYTKHSMLVYRVYEETFIIKELFTTKEERASGYANALYLQALEIAKEARCTNLTCTVDLRANGSKHAFEVVYAHGFRPVRAENNIIVLAREV